LVNELLQYNTMGRKKKHLRPLLSLKHKAHICCTVLGVKINNLESIFKDILSSGT